MQFVLQPWQLYFLILAGLGESATTGRDRKRQTTWKTFIQAHWDVLAAIDFTTVEVGQTTGEIEAIEQPSRLTIPALRGD